MTRNIIDITSCPAEVGKPLEITYKPLNLSRAKRQVVWQPVTKKTGLPKTYWYHLAVALKFHRVDDQSWCLSIRPEMHVTKDSQTPLDHEWIGSKVTRKKSRMYNYDLLGEVHFWRDFLSESQPRILLPFGRGQLIHTSTTLMQTDICWPGMPEEFQKPFKNIAYQDDLFTWAAWHQLEDASDDDEWDEQDEEAEELWDED